ncbi:MAG: cobyric acid synthase CobQ, partial [Halobaculum sp.]
GRVTGYEIHHGETRVRGDVTRPFDADGAATDRVLGTYLHGLFENEIARERFLDAVFDAADVERPAAETDRQSPHDAAAELLRENVDLGALGLPE